MSVMMTLRMQGDPRRLEEHTAADPESLRAITEMSKSHGVIAHRFYGTEDGQIMVVDEWPDRESFESFFAEAGERIGAMMAAVGVAEQPRPEFWRKLETHDEVGWGA